MYGYQELAKILIEKGADKNYADENMITPLISACSTNQLDMVKFLIENHVDLEIYNCNIFFQAHLQNILLLLAKNGASFFEDENNISHEFLLDVSCKFGFKELLDYLIEENNINVNTTVHDGTTPILCAFENKQYELVEYFISKGADMGLCDNSLIYLTLRSKNIKYVKMFVENGANIYKFPYSGKSCLNLVEDSKEIANFLAVYLAVDLYKMVLADDFESAFIKSIETLKIDDDILVKKEFLEAFKIMVQPVELNVKIKEQTMKDFEGFSKSIDQIKEKLKNVVCAHLKFEKSNLENLIRKLKLRYVELNIERILKTTEENDEDEDEDQSRKTSYLDLINLSITEKLYETIDSNETIESKLFSAYSYYELTSSFISKIEECLGLTENLIRYLDAQKESIVQFSNKIMEINAKLQTDTLNNQENLKQEFPSYEHINNPLIIAAEKERFDLLKFLINDKIRSKEDLLNICDGNKIPFLFMLCKYKSKS